MITGKMLGITIGILVGLLIGIIILKYINQDSKIRAKYDERQQLVRGKAYRLAFWTAVILMALYSMADAYGLDLPIKRYIIPFIIIIISILVHATYAIFNDGYFGVNENRKKAFIVFVLIGLLNFGVAVLEIKRGKMMEDGKLGAPFMNLICGISFVLIGIVLIIKNMITKEDIDEEEE